MLAPVWPLAAMASSLVMSSTTPPDYIADYPTGRSEPMGHNLRATAHNSSRYTAPLQSHNRTLAAVIMPISRPIASVRSILLQNMRLCERHGIQLVALCSGSARASDVAKLDKEFEAVEWTAVDGPFEFAAFNFTFASSDAPFWQPPGRDLAAKRNFGLLLALSMGWSHILFVDDDMHLTDDLISRQIALARQGAVVAAHNSRDYPDHSVVVGAYRELFGPDNIDTYLSSQALLLSLEDGALSFYPQVYNEDWLFVFPYLLMYGKATWSGSAKQREYNRFVRQRAKDEEAGDLVAEGLMRLAVDIFASHGERDYDELLDTLAERANGAFWEKEILHRAVFIRELLLRNSGRFARPGTLPIRRSLTASLRTLVGDDTHSGLDPESIGTWVTSWVDDLKRWRDLKVESTAGGRIAAVLQELGALDRALYRELGRGLGGLPRAHGPDTSGAEDPVAQALIRLPEADRDAAQIRGVASTWVMSHYMDRERLRFDDFRRATGRLRYDRPIRSLLGNKPVGTVVIAVRAFESVESIVEGFRRIVTSTGPAKPIHVIVWLSAGHRVTGYYRDYLMARLMLEASGTNIRLLSCIGRPSREPQFDALAKEVISVVGLAYWKNEIDSVGHVIAIANTHGEALLSGELATLLLGLPGESASSLSGIIDSMDSPEQPRPLHTPEESRANALIRQRLLHRIEFSRRAKERRKVHAATRLRKSIDAAGTSWLALDDQHYQTHIHHERGDEALVQTDHVALVLIEYGTHLAAATGALDQALARFATLRSAIGRTADVNFVVYGRESLAALGAYRTGLIDQLLSEREIPPGTALVTHVVQNAAIDDHDDLLKIAEATVRYEYWLASDAAEPELWWVTPSRNGRTKVVRRRPSKAVS